MAECSASRVDYNFHPLDPSFSGVQAKESKRFTCCEKGDRVYSPV
jgi:hypothetical protein